MDFRRLAAFLLIVIIAFAGIGISSPGLLQQIKLGLDLKGGFEILYVAEPVEGGEAVTQDSLRETAKSLEKRANAYGVAEPEVAPEGKDRIRARIAGVENAEEVRSIMQKPASLTFRGPDGKVEMVGSDFAPGAATVQFSQTGQPYIALKIKEKDKFKDVTTRLLGQPLAIYLDDRELSAPTVQNVISNGEATISGRYSYNEAKEIASTINLGALPLKLTEKYMQKVDATLGQLSMQQTLEAAVIGSLLIILFMLIFYRLPGVVASITLVVFTWLLLLIFMLMGVTVTLPGIAAFVLGIGIAVDSNIITSERIKEELRHGKSYTSALKAGSKNSFRTIIDAHVTTIIAAAVLYSIGTGSVQGFALILIMSILVNLVTNVFLPRVLLNLLIRSNYFNKPGYFGVKEAEIREL